MVDYHGTVLKIYQDFSQTPTVVALSSNPYSVSLPMDHRYKIEVYVSSMYANVDFVNLASGSEKSEMSIPIPGSVLFTVVSADGNTPIEGASVSLRSGDDSYKYWTNSTTDEFGNTIRFWVQPTVLQDDYYVADVSIGDGLSYAFSPITVDPGRSQEIKITTPWPSVIDHIVAVSVYKSPTEKISGLGNNLAVELYDKENNRIASSAVTDKGYAYFSNLKVGSYMFRAVDLGQTQNQELGSTSVLLTGKQDSVQILANPEPQNSSANQTVSASYDTSTNLLEITAQELTSKLSPNPSIPTWIKNISEWWANDLISDSEFLKAVEYLVQHNVIDI